MKKLFIAKVQKTIILVHHRSICQTFANQAMPPSSQSLAKLLAAKMTIMYLGVRRKAAILEDRQTSIVQKMSPPPFPAHYANAIINSHLFVPNFSSLFRQ